VAVVLPVRALDPEAAVVVEVLSDVLCISASAEVAEAACACWAA
jgi:hypothetical protein